MKQISKIITLFLVSLLFPFLSGCSGDLVMPPNAGNDTELDIIGDFARATFPEESYSSTNPNLIVDWERQKYITLNTLGNGVNNIKVSAPWNSGFTVGSAPYEFCDDVKREDGWKMLFHTFRNEGENPNVNYMCLYNMFTGYLKIFYYNESSTSASSIQWKVVCGNNEVIPHSLLEGCPILTPVDGEHIESSEGRDGIRLSNMISHVELINGWNGFQIPISRYEEYPENLNLSIGAESHIITDFNFDSLLEATTEGQVVSVSTQDKSEFKAMATLAGKGARGMINKLGEKIRKDSTLNLRRFNFLKEKFGGWISNLKSKDIAEGILSGMKLFFGKSIVTQNVYTTSDVYLTQNGTITTTGQSVSIQSSNFKSIRFNLHELLNNKNTAGELVVTPEITRGAFKGLGVWTLEYTPRVYYNPLTRFVPTYVCDNGPMSECDIEGFTEYPEIVAYELDVKFNPMLDGIIKDYDVDVEFVESDLFCEFPDSNPRIVLSQNEFLSNHLDYLIPHHKRDVVKADMRGETFDKSKRWFYNWGEAGNRRTVAMVTVKMVICHQGKDIVVTETRAYKTDSHIIESSAPSNPVRWDLLNRLRMRIISEGFEVSVLPYEP